jgi:hypothetical protein
MEDERFQNLRTSSNIITVIKSGMLNVAVAFGTQENMINV